MIEIEGLLGAAQSASRYAWAVGLALCVAVPVTVSTWSEVYASAIPPKAVPLAATIYAGVFVFSVMHMSLQQQRGFQNE